MKNISFRDLQLCSRFKGLNEISMLALSNDDNMSWALAQLGFDVEYPISYIPRKHRDSANKVALGFMAVGEINLNSSYIDSPMCTLTERMIAAAYTDPSLTRELSSLMGMRVNFRALLDSGSERGGENLPDDMLEPDHQYIADQIVFLETVRDGIRGNPYNDRGEFKCFSEYK